jgi:DnaJ-class molecular chaperone
MTVLSDSTKRRQYDQLGSTDAFERRENSGGSSGGGRGQPGFRRGHFAQFNDDDFVSPEDFFNFMFFGQ